jgi:hypothetical protein
MVRITRPTPPDLPATRLPGAAPAPVVRPRKRVTLLLVLAAICAAPFVLIATIASAQGRRR